MYKQLSEQTTIFVNGSESFDMEIIFKDLHRNAWLPTKK